MIYYIIYCIISATVPPKHVVECPGAGRPFQAWSSVAQRQLLLGWANPITQGSSGLLGITRGFLQFFLTHFFVHGFSHRSGSLLGPSWGHLGLHLGGFWKPKAMPASTSTKMTKLHFRVDEAQKKKVSRLQKKHRKSMEQPLPSK